ncbi:hypothetical protein BJY00DRAFT_297471 [Aspergillus carlsbadensis]|nr:hypothetical protein BJY00DRAFT_297471 [Aspergillus carlsbadensis]
MDKSEILVHISAPSGVLDDARYRAQVEAILNFQSRPRELITLQADETPSHLASSPLHSSTSPHPNNTDTGSISSPSRVPVQAAKRPASLKDSLGSPVSVIPDSQPQQPDSIAESLHLAPSSLPFKRPRLGSPSRSLHDEVWRPDPVGNDAPAATSTTNANVTAQDEQENELEEPEVPPERQEQNQFLFQSILLEIKPPPPPISSSPFTTHITPTLEMLTKRLKSPRTYNPTSQTRDLDSLERGYWYLRIDINSHDPQEPVASTPNPMSWDTASFHNFWKFLFDFIAKEGRAGWGVWCIAEDETPTEAPGVGEASRPQIIPKNTQQQLAVRIYAWGEIACHIYLLLFLASERRIRKMGAQWRDARDDVVIQMP